MERQTQQLFEFGPFQLDVGERLLRRDHQILPLTPKAFEILLALVENSGHLLEKDELMKRVWPESFVEESNLAQQIFTLRKVLGEENGVHYIETVPKHGYRFIAPVRLIQPREPIAESSNAGPAAARAGAARIAPRLGRLILALSLAALVYFVWRTTSAPAAPAEPATVTLAVLPLEDLSADSSREYFADGLTEEMISQLSRMYPERLAVIARTSAMRYKGTRKSVAEIGRELNADYILEGSVRRENNLVRVSAQLIRAAAQTQVWTGQFEREASQILPLQDDLARSIARGIALSLTPEQDRQLIRSRLVNPQAYEHYLQGRYFWNKRTEEGFLKSIEHFQQAIALDPEYAPSYAGLADAYALLNEYSVRLSSDAFPKASAAAARALALDESLAEAHNSFAYTQFYYNWNWSAAEKSFTRALALNPNYATAHQWYGEFLVSRGRFSEAQAEIERARQLDPLSLATNSALAFSFYYAGDFDRAIAQYRKVIEMDEGFAIAHYGLGWALQQKGDLPAAQREFETAIRMIGPDTDAIAALGQLAVLEGRPAEARKILAGLQALARRKYVSPVNVAMLYVSLGENERALQWLRRAFQERYGWLAFLRIDARFERLRGEPGFQELLKEIESGRKDPEGGTQQE